MLLLCAILLAGCELASTPIAPTSSQLVVHAVLNRGAVNQVVLLERSLSGRVFLVDVPFDAVDPIVTGGGIPASGAVLTITQPDGTVLVGREDAQFRLDGRGAGVYRVLLSGSELIRGGTYRLHVRTREGEELSAETTVPSGELAGAAPAVEFNRDGSALELAWQANNDSARYAVILESANGPFTTFTDVTAASVSGELRHAALEGLPRVFTAGFDQTVSVLSIDANYYDYFRTNNLPWSGAGIVSRVSGGIGVFGSAVRVHQQLVRVVKSRTAPVEARFVYVGTPTDLASSIAREIDLFVESPGRAASQPDAISGRYVAVSGTGGGVVGTLLDGELRIAFLRGFNVQDTLEVFNGRLVGDSIGGRYRNFAVPGAFVRATP